VSKGKIIPRSPDQFTEEIRGRKRSGKKNKSISLKSTTIGEPGGIGRDNAKVAGERVYVLVEGKGVGKTRKLFWGRMLLRDMHGASTKEQKKIA